MPTSTSSRLSGFYQKSVAERTAIVAQWAGLSPDEINVLHDGLSVAQADKMIENVIGRYSLPMGIGVNFLINDREYLVPMVVEEPSVVAAVSYAAKLARSGGGFRTGSTPPIMIAQVQLLGVTDPRRAQDAILAERGMLLELANTSPTIAAHGGGPVDIEVHWLAQTPTEPMLIVHLLFDTRDAMGANAVNTAAEAIAPTLERLTGGRALLRILSNLTDRRRAWAEVKIPAASFGAMESSGADVITGIAHANAFAWADPYRAATHNKGILNGIDAVALATGNDWRALEAGAHAYAARDGQYRALTEWRVITEEEADLREDLADERAEMAGQEENSQLSMVNRQLSMREQSDDRGNEGGSVRELDGGLGDEGSRFLVGRLEMPMAVGIVGGATRSHPVAHVALKILKVTSASELSEVMVAVGLAQNLSAIRALATEGIQRGHMSLHARQIAITAGAQGADVDRIAAQLVAENQIRVERARAILLTPPP